MRILVAGANGFIGKSACSFLARKGHTVAPIVRSNVQASFFALHYPEVVVADLTKSGCDEALKRIESDVVVHLAAELPKSFHGDEASRAAASNSQIDYNVFKFCTTSGTGLIYASGTSVYGLGNGRIKRESDDIDPVGPYVEQKVESERLGKELLLISGLQFASLRICAPYGPGQNARTVLNIFMERALAGLSVLYHGTGSREQDFTFISDVSLAIALVAEKRRSGVFNIAGGRPVTMKKLAELVVSSVPNCQSEVHASGQDDPQEGSTALFSIKKAKDELGWTPRVGLEEGLKRCVQARLNKNQ